jgi:uncharacterized membrane protein YhiD involved in acid resistance
LPVNENSFSPTLLKMIDLNAYDVFMGMSLAFVLCAILSRIVRACSPADPTSDRTLARTMILLGAVVSLIMAVIGNSLARAFGAIGALSLIRFRTAVKSTTDLAWLFMSIAIGMTCGSGYYTIATGAAGLFAIFIVILGKLMPEAAPVRTALFKVVYPLNTETARRLQETAAGLGLHFRLLSENSLNNGSKAEIMFEVTLPKEAMTADCLKKLCEVAPEVQASVVLE